MSTVDGLRFDGVENVAAALFKEWQTEIEQYSSATLKADSQAKLRETERRYDEMITVLRRSEAKMDPVLAALKDNVMYLKHNLNARAVASLKVEFGEIEDDIEALIREMRKAIASSDASLAKGLLLESCGSNATLFAKFSQMACIGFQRSCLGCCASVATRAPKHISSNQTWRRS